MVMTIYQTSNGVCSSFISFFGTTIYLRTVEKNCLDPSRLATMRLSVMPATSGREPPSIILIARKFHQIKVLTVRVIYHL